MIWTSRPVLWPRRDEQVTASLATAASSLISFCRVIQPVIAAVQTDAELSRRFRGRLAAQGRGPQRGTKVAGEYLTAEQALGGVAPVRRSAGRCGLADRPATRSLSRTSSGTRSRGQPPGRGQPGEHLAGRARPAPLRLGKGSPMVNIHLVRDTQLPPERIIGALTGFCDRRLGLFLNLGRQYFTVYETASTRHRRHEAGGLEPGAPAG